ncbi:MAG TPA: alpha/beta hydrolase [Acidimicrobiales bacterium]|nr:alpha/beta hydrolase [Acidimicrobiales bacterium]
MERPETKYVTVGDADVAYQVFGQGSPDVLFCYGLGSHIDYFWDLDQLADFWRRIATKNRSILFDRRGTATSCDTWTCVQPFRSCRQPPSCCTCGRARSSPSSWVAPSPSTSRARDSSRSPAVTSACRIPSCTTRSSNS